MNNTPNAVSEKAKLANDLISGKARNPSHDDPAGNLEANGQLSAQSGSTEPVEPPKPVEAPSKEGDPEYWKQRFRIMEGKYKAEVEPLRNEVKQLKEQVAQGNSGGSGNDFSKKLDDAISSELTKEELEDYGEDLIGIIRKVASQVANQAADSKIQPFGETIQNIQESQKHDSEASFWSSLKSSVPDWRNVNESSEFADWLNDLDPMSGVRRQALLEDAQSKLDAYRVIQIFNSFKQQSGAPRSSIPAEKVHPGQSKQTAKPASNDRSFSRAEIKKFYADKARGLYANKPEEAAALEREIFMAQQKGHIY